MRQLFGVLPNASGGAQGHGAAGYRGHSVSKADAAEDADGAPRSRAEAGYLPFQLPLWVILITFQAGR